MASASRGLTVRRAFVAALLALAAAASALAVVFGASPARARVAASPVEFGCPILPEEDVLNQEIATAPVSPNSANYVASIGLTAHLHPDFGTPTSYGIPY